MDAPLVRKIALELYEASGRNPRSISRRVVVAAVKKHLGEDSDAGAGSTTLINAFLTALRLELAAERKVEEGSAPDNNTADGAQPSYPEIAAEFARHAVTSTSIMQHLLLSAQQRADEEHTLRQRAADGAARKRQAELSEELEEASADMAAVELELADARSSGEAGAARIAELELQLSGREQTLDASVTESRAQSVRYEVDMRRAAATLADAEAAARDAAVALGTLRGEHTVALTRAAEVSTELDAVRSENKELAVTASSVARLQAECDTLRVQDASRIQEMMCLRSELAAAVSRADLVDHLTATFGARSDRTRDT